MSSLITALFWVPRGLTSAKVVNPEEELANADPRILAHLQHERPPFPARQEQEVYDGTTRDGEAETSDMEIEEENGKAPESDKGMTESERIIKLYGLEEDGRNAGDRESRPAELGQDEYPDHLSTTSSLASAVIEETDDIIIAARAEDDMSSAALEVYVYEVSSDSLYVHHDILLPSMPLCIEHVQYQNQNLVAVGTMDPEIEIWDVNNMQPTLPSIILGLNKHEGMGKGGSVDGYHKDAVLDLSWCSHRPETLASASADETIRIWDISVSGGLCTQSLHHHRAKVQSVAWNPAEPFSLLSGGHDRSAVITDIRSSRAECNTVFTLSADVETLLWDSQNFPYVLISLEDGNVLYFDQRMHEKPVWRLQAHDEAVTMTALHDHKSFNGLLATGSSDKAVKLWHVSPEGSKFVTSRVFGGGVFGGMFRPSGARQSDLGDDLGLAVAGVSGQLEVWDVSSVPEVRQLWPEAARLHRGAKDRIIRRGEDSDDD